MISTNVFNEDKIFLLCFNHHTLQHLSQKTGVIARYEAHWLVRDLTREVLLMIYDTLMLFLLWCGIIFELSQIMFDRITNEIFVFLFLGNSEQIITTYTFH